MGSAFMHGWVSLPSRGEIYLEHGIPRQARTDDPLADTERLIDEIADLTGLHVSLNAWESDAESGDMLATVKVNAADLGEVMTRLARASAETFYDRYHKTIDAGATDFDDEACAEDFNLALRVCGLNWQRFALDELGQASLRDGYRLALHQAVEEIAAAPQAFSF